MSTARALGRIAAAITGGAVAAACGPGPLDPGRTGGRLLPGTEGVAYLNGRPLSISPDHRWVTFALERLPDSASSGDLAELQLEQLRAYVLHDLDRDRGAPVAIGDDVVDFVRTSSAGILLDGGCWLETAAGLRVALRDSFNRPIAFDPGAEQPVWEMVQIDREALNEHCPVPGPYRPPTNPVGAFDIRGRGTRSVRIVSAADPSTVYATHSAPLLTTELQVGHVRLSPDGRRLAYSINPAFGSFVSNSRAFVLDADDPSGSATPLASPAYELRWAPDGSALYAAVQLEETMALYRWDVAALFARGGS